VAEHDCSSSRANSHFLVIQDGEKMKFGVKLIIIAVLASSVGVAFASPLLYENLVVRPFPRIPEGPKADFSVNIVYANFSVQEHASNKSSHGSPLSILTYDIVLNVTNLSDLRAVVNRLDFKAAEEVTSVPSVLGGSAAISGGVTGGGHSDFVEGIWLDGKWLNVTWLPDGEWPTFVNSPIVETIPDLPSDVSEEGVWVEGVHVNEGYRIIKTANETNITFTTLVFINGAWVDATGRVRVDYEQPFVVFNNPLTGELRNFASETFGSYRNEAAFDEALAEIFPAENVTWTNIGITYTWAGKGGFNSYWEPHESRLIRLTGTRDVGEGALELLAEEKITLYSAVSNSVKDWTVINGTYYNTFSTATSLKQVQIEKTADDYLYNTILGENQIFQPDQYGVEVFIKPRS
jgi:hypothetical protein